MGKYVLASYIGNLGKMRLKLYYKAQVFTLYFVAFYCIIAKYFSEIYTKKGRQK